MTRIPKDKGFRAGPDPESPASASDGIRPSVRLPRGGLSGAAIAVGAAVAAVFLFSVLEARRQAPSEPAVRPQAADASAAVAEPPPLHIPPEPMPVALVLASPAAAPVQAMPQPPAQRSYAPVMPPPPAPPPPNYYPQPPAPPVAAASPPSRNSSGSALVIDTTVSVAGSGTGGAAGAPGGASPLQAGSQGVERARSGMLANRATTVPQGTLIPAVLETAFDSTRPGFARAIVSRDVRGFDGSKVLIPRGSRLVGEYLSDVAPGQKRAVINWTRLTRPDGAVIALASPAVDPLGRGGIRASVNSHMPERVFGALLQSTFQIGSVLATRAATGSVLVALPNSVQGSMGSQIVPSNIVPTLKVPAATSISIFVARDLEFPTEDQQ